MQVKCVSIDVSANAEKYEKILKQFFSYYYPFYRAFYELQFIVSCGNEKYTQFFDSVFDEVVERRIALYGISKRIGEVIVGTDKILDVRVNVETDVLTSMYVEE